MSDSVQSLSAHQKDKQQDNKVLTNPEVTLPAVSGLAQGVSKKPSFQTGLIYLPFVVV